MQNKIYSIFKSNKIFIFFFPFSHFMQLQDLIWAHLNVTDSEHYCVFHFKKAVSVFQHFPILLQGSLSFFFHNLCYSSTVLIHTCFSFFSQTSALVMVRNNSFLLLSSYCVLSGLLTFLYLFAAERLKTQHRYCFLLVL